MTQTHSSANLGVPPELDAALVEMKEQLAQAAGANLYGLLLYGGAARGRFRARKTDVNVAVVLHDASAARITAVAPVLHAAWRSIRVEPLILTLGEIALLTDVFPVKILEIQTHHVLLAGQDPFKGLTITREHLRLRIEQELRNMVLRLRRRLVPNAGVPAELLFVLSGVVRPMAVEFASLLHFAGKDAPPDDRASAVFAAAASAFDLDAEALAQLVAVREAAQIVGTPMELYARVLACLEKAVQIIDGMDPHA
jgi:hypothetical protein